MEIDKNKILFMKYPKDKGNESWDGLFHRIKPERLRRFIYNNAEFYVLDYIEEDGRYFNTILTKEGSSFVKVPLYDYSNFNEICANAEEVSLDILNGTVYILTLEPVKRLDELIVSNNNDYSSSIESADYDRHLTASKKQYPPKYSPILKKFKFYIALDYDFFSPTQRRYKYYQAYENKTDEMYVRDNWATCFHNTNSCYDEILLKYLDSIKRNDKRPFSDRKVFTLDKKNNVIYEGKHNIENGVVIEYVIEQCDSIEKTNDIRNKDMFVSVPENFQYKNTILEISKDIKFINGINGNYTLYTFSNIFKGKENKQQPNSLDDFGVTGRKK